MVPRVSQARVVVVVVFREEAGYHEHRMANLWTL